MKKITLLTAIAMIAFTVNTFGQTTADGTSTATVIAPLGLAAGADLAFGNITEYGGGGTITVAAASTTTSATGTDAQSMGGTVTAGSFTVTGQTGEVYSITLPVDGTVTLSSAATGAVAMPVKTFTSDISQGTIGTNDTFYVGATLEVGADQTAGAYTGSYTVTVQYL